MVNVIVDCEASGPCPVFGDLIEFAAITETNVAFKSDKLKPIYDLYEPGAYKVLGIERSTHEAYTGEYAPEFDRFGAWLKDITDGGAKRPIFWSDNPAIDWQWINFGFAYSCRPNPFGFSARRIGDLYAGLKGDIRNQKGWKRYRVTKHTHDPLDDARGAMEAFKRIRQEFKL